MHTFRLLSEGLGCTHDTSFSPDCDDCGSGVPRFQRFCRSDLVNLGHTIRRAALCAVLVLLFSQSVGALGARAEVRSEVLCTIADPRLTEISGMAPSSLHENVMWVHNDSGDAARLYALSLQDCNVVGELTLRDVSARDLEGLAAGVDAQGRPVLWVGDIGDNLDSWDSVAIYRVREPKNLGKKSARAQEFRFTYKDRPHNAETILADPDSPQLWIVTKQLASGSIYELPAKLSRTQINIATKVISVGGLVTDGAVNPNGSGFVLRDYFDAHFYNGMPPGEFSEKQALPAQIQGEAIAWMPDGQSLVIAGEGDDRLIAVSIAVAQESSSPTPSSSTNTVTPVVGELTENSVNYLPLVVGVIGAIALVTGLVIISRKPRDSAMGKKIKAE